MKVKWNGVELYVWIGKVNAENGIKVKKVSLKMTVGDIKMETILSSR